MTDRDPDVIARVIVTAVKAATGPMASDAAALAVRLATLEARHEVIHARLTTVEAHVDTLEARIGQLVDSAPKALVTAVQADLEGLRQALQQLPVPKDGRDGQPGIPGRDGGIGPAGEKGRDGTDGRDGTLEASRLEQVDDRTVRQVRADGSELGRVVFPVVLDRGVYQAGRTYEKGDAVTFGGYWIAQDTTSEKPGDGATKWRLAIRAGRDGREGKPGPQGLPGLKGDRGEPGRNFS